MTEHVLVFSIGPVQGFISAARRGRDLWFSSWLLSEMARAAAASARQHLVMPTATSVDSGATVPNKLLLHVRGAAPRAVAAEMEKGARARLEAIAKAAFEKVARQLRGRFDAERALEQVRDLPEFAWASAPILRSDYGTARREAEALLAARKSSRPFCQPSWGDSVPKSSLDGERESVLHPDADERALFKLGIGARERLCGVGLLKRVGHRALDEASSAGARVLSTSHVASWSTRRRWKGLPEAVVRELRAAFDDYRAVLEGHDADLSDTREADPVLGRADGHVLYETRLRDLFPKDAAQQVAEATQALRRLYGAWRDVARRHGFPAPDRPTPYYAVLLADGDRMGRTIDHLDEDGQRELTEAVERFATAAAAAVRKHHGHCVYAGGDDVLALVPVTEALACAKALNEAFASVSAVAAARLATLPERRHEPPTLSIGICVSHHVDPLQDALEGARAAEKHAKQQLGRAAWAVRVEKRGGVPVVTGGKWADLDLLQSPVESWVDGRIDLPRGLPYELRLLAQELPGQDLTDLRKAELNRVLAQKQIEGEARALVLEQAERSDLAEMADRLIVARALSGMEEDHVR